MNKFNKFLKITMLLTASVTLSLSANLNVSAASTNLVKDSPSLNSVDLAVTTTMKSFDPDGGAYWFAGNTVNHRDLILVRVANYENAAAHNLYFSVTIPAGIDLVEVNNNRDNWSCQQIRYLNRVDCDMPSLGGYSVSTFTLSFRAPSTPSSMTSTAVIISSDYEMNPSDNTYSTPLVVHKNDTKLHYNQINPTVRVGEISYVEFQVEDLGSTLPPTISMYNYYDETNEPINQLMPSGVNWSCTYFHVWGLYKYNCQYNGQLVNGMTTKLKLAFKPTSAGYFTTSSTAKTIGEFDQSNNFLLIRVNAI